MIRNRNIWRRRRDSNPGYAFRAYNGLANRRLQPLGHISVTAHMPETGRAGKRMSAVSGCLPPGCLPCAGRYGRHQKSRRRREVAQTLRRLPADDRLRDPHPAPRTVSTWVEGPGGSSLSLADALCHRPRRRIRRPHCNPALCKLASEVTRFNVKSPTVPEHTAPRRCYFFFFAATLRFAGAFFFAAVFAFAFFTMMAS